MLTNDSVRKLELYLKMLMFTFPFLTECPFVAGAINGYHISSSGTNNSSSNTWNTFNKVVKCEYIQLQKSGSKQNWWHVQHYFYSGTLKVRVISSSNVCCVRGLWLKTTFLTEKSCDGLYIEVKILGIWKKKE